MADPSQLAQMKMDTKTTLKASDIHVHDFSLDGKASTPTAADDFLDQVAHAARQATQSRPQATLSMGAVDVDFSGLRADLGDDTPEGKLLREARRLVGEKQYEQALAVLQQVFEVAAHHHEALYLQARCEFELKRLPASLATLSKLKGAVLSNRLQTRVRCLKEEIRQQSLPRAAKVYAEAVKSREASKAIGQLRQFAETDPEVGKFHYFLAGSLVVAKRMLDAHQAATAGLEVCQTDREELMRFRDEIERRVLPELLRPARDLFRDKKYAEADQALDEVPDPICDEPLCRNFRGYLERLDEKGGGGLFSRLLSGKGTTAEPPGSAAEVQEVYAFLVDREMKVARTALDARDSDKAERALAAALSHTPLYSLPNHMLAACVYQRVGTTVKDKIGKDLDEAAAGELRQCQEQLSGIREHAVIASRDPQIDDSKRLLASIDEMRDQIEKVVDKYEVQTHDARLVNQAIDDFVAILVRMVAFNTSSDPWQLRKIAEELYTKLDSMRQSLPTLRRRCKGEQARTIMDLLKDNFVEPNFNTLRRAMNR